jgi:aspartate racemase
MKTIGLIGGTSWISTLEYYRLINGMVNEKLGGLHSAKILLYSVDHEEYKLSPTIDWTSIGGKLTVIAKKLEHAGADCLLICANSMHRVAEEIQEHIRIPLIHIAQETAVLIKEKNLETVGLLGTQVTMEGHFFKEKLSRSGIVTLIPSAEDREFLHSSIMNELGKGIFREETKQRYLTLIGKLREQGAQGIILGCTEIPLLIKQEFVALPVFDTTAIHSKSAVAFALSTNKN